MKVTIERVFKNVKETKFGDKLSVGLKVKEATITDINGEEIEVADRYINGWFPQDFDFRYQEGDQVNLLIKARDKYLDFKFAEGEQPEPSGAPKSTIDSGKLEDLENRVSALENKAGIVTDPDDF